MITQTEIEMLSTKLADLDGVDDDGAFAEGFALIAHLDEADFDAVLSLTEDIRFDRNIAEGSAEALNGLISGAEALVRLAHATGCPDDEPILPWLQEHACAEEGDDGEFRFKMPAPRVVP
jgi:hypothetical protein